MWKWCVFQVSNFSWEVFCPTSKVQFQAPRWKVSSPGSTRPKGWNSGLSSKNCYVVATQRFVMFIPILGKWSNLTNMLQVGWNHQLVVCVPMTLVNLKWFDGRFKDLSDMNCISKNFTSSNGGNVVGWCMFIPFIPDHLNSPFVSLLKTQLLWITTTGWPPPKALVDGEISPINKQHQEFVVCV